MSSSSGSGATTPDLMREIDAKSNHDRVLRIGRILRDEISIMLVQGTRPVDAAALAAF